MIFRPRLSLRASAALLAVASCGAALAGDVFPDDLAWWWPQNIERAARLFHCQPAATNDVRQSLMVWTDRDYRVLAFGSAHEGGRVPAYAGALGRRGSVDASQSVRVAAPGHAVVPARHGGSLRVGDFKLSCARTSDD